MYLKRRDEDFVVTKTATELGPIPSRRRAALAARALASATADEREQLLEGGPLPRLRLRLAQLAEDFRYEEAARLRDRIDALEHVVDRLRRLERLRTLDCCLVVPAVEPGWKKAFIVCGGRISAVRSLPPGAAMGPEIDAALRQAARRSPAGPLTPEEAEDLLLLDGFIRRPPPELAVFLAQAEAA